MLGERDSDAEWMSWSAAAELVGCPPTTIGWYARVGRIERRPRRGSRPTLRRSSVEEFGRQWRQGWTGSESGRRSPASRQTGEPDPATQGAGWVSTAQAAQMLGVTEGHVGWLVRRGRIQARLEARRMWFRIRGIRELALERAEWVSHVEAARIVGCSPQTILQGVRNGKIDSRSAARAQPSLRRSSVEAFARRREDQRREQEAARRRRTDRERARTRAAAARKAPPDATDVWLDSPTVALLLGITANRVRQRARAGRLPHVVKQGRYWFRRDQIERVAAARAFVARRRGLDAPRD